MTRFHLIQYRLLIACTLVSSWCAAQTNERTAAVTLFDEAQRLMAASRFAEACPKFAESYRLDPQLGALLHTADCYEKAGQLASAWAAFRDAAELADRRADERSLTARQRASSLESQLSRLTIGVSPVSRARGLVVARDGAVIGETLWGTAVPVDSGKHVITATAPGKQEWRQVLTVGLQQKDLAVTIPPLANAISAPPTTTNSVGPAALPPALEGSTQKALPSWTKPVGWTAVGLGTVGIGVGVALQLRRSSKIDERNSICPSGENCSQQDQTDINRTTDEARSAGTLSVISLVAGGVLAAGGLTLLFALPASLRNANVHVGPSVGLGYQGVNLTHVW